MSKSKKKIHVPGPAGIAIFIAVASLALSLGIMRWSVLILEEQLQLRTEFEQLKNQQNQVNLQYELWLDRLQQEIEDARKIGS
jgi:hypothetical protein